MAAFTSRTASRAAQATRRDTLRQKVYDAESATVCAGGELLRTIEDVQKYIDRVTDLAVFRRRWGSRRIRALPKRGGSGGYAQSGEVHVGLPCTKWTALHEGAHVIASPLPAAEAGNFHGPTFRRTLLELVGFEFGETAAQSFRDALKKRKLRLGPPTVLRPLDKVPEARPTVHTWRVQLGKDELLILQGTSLASALAQLSSPKYHARFKAADATEVRIWKSRAVSKAAAKGAK